MTSFVAINLETHARVERLESPVPAVQWNLVCESWCSFVQWWWVPVPLALQYPHVVFICCLSVYLNPSWKILMASRSLRDAFSALSSALSRLAGGTTNHDQCFMMFMLSLHCISKLFGKTKSMDQSDNQKKKNSVLAHSPHVPCLVFLYKS